MPEFDFTRRTPQGQVQASGPRDQGTGIRAQATSELAQGLTQLAYGAQDIAKQRVGEQAESDMSAFQAQRIKMEQDFREKSASITNAEEYRKAVDKHITDMNKYAEGKRPDGTKVFRNGMGSASYKQFSRDYSAKFKAQGSEHAFQLDRKRDKLNYRMAINSGIKNSSGNPKIDEAAIVDSYDAMVASGLMLPEEAAIEKEQSIKAMTINHLNNQQAKLLLGAEDILDRVGKEQMVFDGTGVKPHQDTLANAAQTIKGAFETYKAEVYTNKNLNDQERKSLLANAKAGLMAVNHKVKGQKKAADLQRDQNYVQAQIEVESTLYNDPAADPEEVLLQVKNKYNTVIKPEDNLKMLKDLNAHQNKRLKAETSKKAAIELASSDIAAEEEAYSYNADNDPKGTRWRDVMRRVGRMPASVTKTNVVSLMNEKSPFNKKGSSPLSEFTSNSMNQMRAELGLNLTEAEFKKLDSERTMKPLANKWNTWDRGFTPEQEARFKDSPEKFYDFTPESMRQNYLNKVMRDAQRMFQDGKPEDAKAHITQELNILKKEKNDLKQIENYLKEAKPRNTNPYSFVK